MRRNSNTMNDFPEKNRTGTPRRVDVHEVETFFFCNLQWPSAKQRNVPFHLLCRSKNYRYCAWRLSPNTTSQLERANHAQKTCLMHFYEQINDDDEVNCANTFSAHSRCELRQCPNGQIRILAAEAGVVHKCAASVVNTATMYATVLVYARAIVTIGNFDITTQALIQTILFIININIRLQY